MKMLIQKARGLKSMVSLLRDPNKLNEVFEIAENLVNPAFLERMAEKAKEHEDGAKSFHDRPRIGAIDLDELSKCPEGSLGREFALHMKKNGLDPSALPSPPAVDDASYVRAHLYETHDIWHAVTGFQTDVAGELGLQAFYLAQLPSRLAGTLLTGGLANMMLWNFDDRDARLNEITRGWIMGKTAKPFFGARWAEMWNEPLSEVRRRFGIEPASELGIRIDPAKQTS